MDLLLELLLELQLELLLVLLLLLLLYRVCTYFIMYIQSAFVQCTKKDEMSRRSCLQEPLERNV